jgi:hypothetical protein
MPAVWAFRPRLFAIADYVFLCRKSALLLNPAHGHPRPDRKTVRPAGAQLE